LEKLEIAKKENVCVDTDILVDFLRRREPGFSIYNKHNSHSKLAISSISAFELLFGANLSSKREQRVSEVQSLFELHSILPFDRGSATCASVVAADLRSRGKAIEIRDLFNAAICLSREIPILTRNRSHYERIAKLGLISS
jgi:tRNA(fMet)-specific endonuclease VapC